MLGHTEAESEAEAESERKDPHRLDDAFQETAFEERWETYPNKEGKKDARRHFRATVTNEERLRRFDLALENYLKYLEIDRKKWGRQPKNGSTFFKNWQDEKWQQPPPNENKHDDFVEYNKTRNP